MSSHATLSAAADDRKARLAKLKSLKRKQPDPSGPEQDDDPEAPTHDTSEAAAAPSPPSTDVARMHLSGRNYDPETRGPKLGFEAPPTLALANPTLEEQAADLEEESRRQAAMDEQDDKGIDLFKLQPKKPNWDLKRELNQKMEVLNVRTDNAIARMVRERLAAKKAAAAGAGDSASGAADGEGGLLEGAAFVEGMRLREKEEEEEARREREAEAEDLR
ncbi:cwf18 pre-mRNA splicing factor-domain-containing protein [Podospora aff. communis PSN243]|uniref:Cwf18 pre-mRNA splicing factor-domain-containing protein n=1 Tax=Podospora aff. communis PSN243 TaxID=3040156 RepID=A0AAV9GL57_9PEZI|nr:cwf18 pre-mRNA splicing factor-domain-containing protein [Podospora aff. communis PSN243]